MHTLPLDRSLYWKGNVKRNSIRLTDKNWNLDGKLNCYIRINVLSFKIYCGCVRENPHS